MFLPNFFPYIPLKLFYQHYDLHLQVPQSFLIVNWGTQYTMKPLWSCHRNIVNICLLSVRTRNTREALFPFPCVWRSCSLFCPSFCSKQTHPFHCPWLFSGRKSEHTPSVCSVNGTLLDRHSFRHRSLVCRTLHLHSVWSHLTEQCWQLFWCRLTRPAVSPWFYNMQGGVHGSSRTYILTGVSKLLSHLLWKLGLWMIWESFPKESMASTGSSVCTVLSWWGFTAGLGDKVFSKVLILGRNWARAGTPRSKPCSLCRWFPMLSRAPCLSEM